ncbi:MAG: hypothetical protein EXR72_03960 [Myxococcales bacterium]|nr:hypothetical protein [Myxococcales bacterium]
MPDDLLQPPGVELFVEVVDRAGKAVTSGSAQKPLVLPIDALAGGPVSPGPGHSAVRGYFEFVDFNRFRGNDYYLLTESDFMYRIGPWLYSVRTGFGILTGRGGKVADLDPTDNAPVCPHAKDTEDKTCGHEVGFNYGYIEGEFHFGRLVGASTRLLAGHTVQGQGVGLELRLRVGSETGTNLVAGMSVFSNIGMLGLLQLEWDVIKGWPMSASVMVTNQPAGGGPTGGDIGVRLVYQVGYRAKSWLQPTLRIGYGARNIDHGGMSVGLGLVMGW